MERNYNVSGAERKALVKVIGEALGVKPKYMGTPSYAFRIGNYEVSRNGVLTFEEDGETASVLAAIEAAGFIAEQEDVEQDAPEATTEPQANEIAEEAGILQDVNGVEIEPQEAEPTFEKQPAERRRTPSTFPSVCRGKPSPIPHWRTWMPCSKARGISSRRPSVSRRQATR